MLVGGIGEKAEQAPGDHRGRVDVAKGQESIRQRCGQSRKSPGVGEGDGQRHGDGGHDDDKLHHVCIYHGNEAAAHGVEHHKGNAQQKPQGLGHTQHAVERHGAHHKLGGQLGDDGQQVHDGGQGAGGAVIAPLEKLRHGDHVGQLDLSGEKYAQQHQCRHSGPVPPGTGDANGIAVGHGADEAAAAEFRGSHGKACLDAAQAAARQGEVIHALHLSGGAVAYIADDGENSRHTENVRDIHNHSLLRGIMRRQRWLPPHGTDPMIANSAGSGKGTGHAAAAVLALSLRSATQHIRPSTEQARHRAKSLV